MKRALFLGYYIPPRNAIASVRSGQLIDALEANGYDVVVVTPESGEAHYPYRVHTTGVLDFKAPVRKLLRVPAGATTHASLGADQKSVGQKNDSVKTRAIRFGYDVTEFANRRFGWMTHGRATIAELLRNERFDVIVSTSPPETTHLVAASVHGEVPWIADLRDPWLREKQVVGLPVFNFVDRALEPRTFRTASALMTVSEPIAAALRARYPGKPVASIPNAFSAREWDGVPFVRPDAARFVYAGQLYSGRRDPTPLLEALAYLVKERLVGPDEVRFDFYGPHQPWLEEAIVRFGLRRCVHQNGSVGRREIFEIERAASRLLMFLWDDPSEAGTYTGKLFEYLGARRKILAVGGPPGCVVDDVLQHTGAGIRARSAHGLRDAILQAVVEWRSGNDAVLSEADVAPYESATLAQRFLELVESCERVTLAH